MWHIVSERNPKEKHNLRKIVDNLFIILLISQQNVIELEGRARKFAACTKLWTSERIGELKKILAELVSHSVTHFVLSKGAVFKTDKLIPAQWIDSVEDGQVRLAVENEIIQRLPKYKD